MRHSIYALFLVSLSAATPALAGAVVIGVGISRDCYDATLLEATPMRNVEALAICDRAVAEFTDNTHNRAASFVNRADILLRMRKYPEAIADSEKGISLSPEIGVAYLNRGAGMIGLQRYADALASLDKAIELGVGQMQLAYFDRAIAKENLGDIRGAYYDFRKSTQLDPTFQLAAEQLSRFTVKTH